MVGCSNVQKDDTVIEQKQLNNTKSNKVLKKTVIEEKKIVNKMIFLKMNKLLIIQIQ
jgi:hypothetical protein